MEKRGRWASSFIRTSLFGEDMAGEMYVVDIQGGVIYRISGGSLPPS